MLAKHEAKASRSANAKSAFRFYPSLAILFGTTRAQRFALRMKRARLRLARFLLRVRAFLFHRRDDTWASGSLGDDTWASGSLGDDTW